MDTTDHTMLQDFITHGLIVRFTYHGAERLFHLKTIVKVYETDATVGGVFLNKAECDSHSASQPGEFRAFRLSKMSGLKTGGVRDHLLALKRQLLHHVETGLGQQAL